MHNKNDLKVIQIEALKQLILLSGSKEGKLVISVTTSIDVGVCGLEQTGVH